MTKKERDAGETLLRLMNASRRGTQRMTLKGLFALLDLEERYSERRQRLLEKGGYEPLTCECKLDLVILISTGFPFAAFQDLGYRVPAPERLWRQLYGFVTRLKGSKSIREINVEHGPNKPWLAPFRITIIPRDASGVAIQDFRSILELLPDFRNVLMEVAFDFPMGSVIDVEYVRRHFLSGKMNLAGSTNPYHQRWPGASRTIRAYLAARSGRSVAVFERNPSALGASIRNFGMIWPIGQPAGRLHEIALRSRELWLEILQQASFPFFQTGSLHVAYRDDEAAVAKEFAEKAAALGYDCGWIGPQEVLARSSAVRSDGLLGALWSPTEVTMNPRQVVSSLPKFLSDRYGVQFYFNTAVQKVEESAVYTADWRWRANTIIVAAGDDFQTLFPQSFQDPGLTRCKLQMMRTVPQPHGWKLGPSLAFGLTFKHYPTFQVCSTLQALKDRISRETPELERWGVSRYGFANPARSADHRRQP